MAVIKNRCFCVFGLALPEFRKLILDEFIGGQFSDVNGLHLIDLVHDVEQFRLEFGFLLFFTLALKEQFFLHFLHLFGCVFHDDDLFFEHFLALSEFARSLFEDFDSSFQSFCSFLETLFCFFKHRNRLLTFFKFFCKVFIELALFVKLLL